MEEIKNLTKLYYTISEVSSLFDVKPSMIRYWEREFKTIKPTKNPKGDRKFTVKDIEAIKKIYELVKERGFTLEGAKKELEQDRIPTTKQLNLFEEANKQANNELLEKLVSLRSELVALREQV